MVSGWSARCQAPIGCASGWRNWSGSSVPPPRRASARAAEWLVDALRRGRGRGADRGGRRTAPTGGRWDRRRARRPRRARGAARPARCSAPRSGRSAPPGSPTTSRRGAAACAASLPHPHHLQRRLRTRRPRGRAHGRRHRPPRLRPLRPRLPPGDPAARRPPRADREDRHQPGADGAGRRRPAAGRARAPLTGRRAARQARAPCSALGTIAAMAEIGLREVVPGANDNGTAVVALLALARRFARRAARGRPGDPASRRAPRSPSARGSRPSASATSPSCRGRAPSSSASSRSAPPTCWSCAARAS